MLWDQIQDTTQHLVSLPPLSFPICDEFSVFLFLLPWQWTFWRWLEMIGQVYCTVCLIFISLMLLLNNNTAEVMCLPIPCQLHGIDKIDSWWYYPYQLIQEVVTRVSFEKATYFPLLFSFIRSKSLWQAHTPEVKCWASFLEGLR